MPISKEVLRKLLCGFIWRQLNDSQHKLMFINDANMTSIHIMGWLLLTLVTFSSKYQYIANPD